MELAPFFVCPETPGAAGGPRRVSEFVKENVPRAIPTRERPPMTVISPDYLVLDEGASQLDGAPA
jgi:hypothetical protein